MLNSNDRDYLRKREIEEREAAAKAAGGARMAHLELAKLYANRLGHGEEEPGLGTVSGSYA